MCLTAVLAQRILHIVQSPSELHTTLVRAAHNCLVICLDGVLDGHTWPDFERSLQNDAIRAHRHIVCDLSHLRYISSAGVSVFIRLQGEKQDAGGSVHLLRPTASVAEVFKLLGLHALFSIVSDMDAVYQRIASSRR